MKTASVLIISLFFGLTLSAKELDFGDHKSEGLTVKAWGELGEGNHADAIAYASKCIETHGAAALKMQSELKAYASDTEASTY
ncbi:MAG: hypothetical protein ACI8W8_005158, partial [Rhodothermales bacterium]